MTVVEIVSRPAFGPAEAWQVRLAAAAATVVAATDPGDAESPREELELFVKIAPAQPHDVGDAEFTRVPADPNRLRDIVARVRALVVSPPPPATMVAVADGSRYQLEVSGGIEAGLRVSWTDGYAPVGWAQVVREVRVMLDEFQRQRAVDVAGGHVAG